MPGEITLQARDLSLWYGSFRALKGVNMAIRSHAITGIIGPSGCGKSTLLRCFNRMNELLRNVHVMGEILLEGRNIYDRDFGVTELRKRVGMVFQRPNPFPLSVFDNIAYGLRIHGRMKRTDVQGVVESTLRATLLWDTLKDRLKMSALELSPEQQQRLCISRLMAVEPEVLLMDEPCSALDPVATQRIEELMQELARRYTIVIVTHNMQQAARVSSEIGFMLLGELVEFGRAETIFTSPEDKRTEEYVTGRYG